MRYAKRISAIFLDIACKGCLICLLQIIVRKEIYGGAGVHRGLEVPVDAEISDEIRNRWNHRFHALIEVFFDMGLPNEFEEGLPGIAIRNDVL